ncbi:MAG: trypsin-like peptidase domain-containing protein [Pleurocapsa sp. MO_226.B13]|nr:trypsin-like peptidase domain-containing protein [Pleurocapsa sp. MO_226.B13]
MNIHRYLAALLIAPALTFTQPSLAQSSKPTLNQKLAMYTKPAVVRIWNTCYGMEHVSDEWSSPVDYNLSFLGTGFLINPNGYIVTSGNVIDKEECINRLADNISRSSNGNQNDIKNSLKFLEQNNIEPFHDQLVILPNSEVEPLPFKIKETGRVSVEGKFSFSEINNDVAIIKIPIENAPTLVLGDSRQVKIQDPVLTVGYPTTADIDLQQKLTRKSWYEASVQKGSIASSTKKLHGGYPILQIDIQAGKGSGGSPLINSQNKVIGMLVSSQSGKDNTIPLAITTNTIREFISQSGTKNDHKGMTDQLYNQGLRLYWKENYEEAKTKFLQVKQSFKVEGVSAHSEVEDLIDKIEQIKTEWGMKPLKNPTYLLLLVLVAGGGVVAAVAYFLLRRQSSARKAFPVSTDVSAEERSVSTNSYERNGFGSTQSWLELKCQKQIRRFQLYKEEHHLGRESPWSDLVIPAEWEVVSRHHAILRKDGEDYRIYDGDGTVPSRNGLWIDDDSRVDPQDGYPLENGDRLKIGQDPHEQVVLTYFNPTTNQAGVKETKTVD